MIVKTKRLVPSVEMLEPRCLLSWTGVGPSPQLQALDFPPIGLSAAGSKLSGRVSDLAYIANYHSQPGQPAQPVLLDGSASGGIFVSSALSAAGMPSWTPLTDRAGLVGDFNWSRRGLGALRTGSVAVSPDATDAAFVFIP